MSTATKEGAASNFGPKWPNGPPPIHFFLSTCWITVSSGAPNDCWVHRFVPTSQSTKRVNMHVKGVATSCALLYGRNSWANNSNVLLWSKLSECQHTNSQSQMAKKVATCFWLRTSHGIRTQSPPGSTNHCTTISSPLVGLHNRNFIRLTWKLLIYLQVWFRFFNTLKGDFHRWLHFIVTLLLLTFWLNVNIEAA